MRWIPSFASTDQKGDWPRDPALPQPDGVFGSLVERICTTTPSRAMVTPDTVHEAVRALQPNLLLSCRDARKLRAMSWKSSPMPEGSGPNQVRTNAAYRQMLGRVSDAREMVTTRRSVEGGSL